MAPRQPAACRRDSQDRRWHGYGRHHASRRWHHDGRRRWKNGSSRDRPRCRRYGRNERQLHADQRSEREHLPRPAIHVDRRRGALFVAASVLPGLYLGSDYYAAQGYIAVAQPACFGRTAEGCLLRWQQVPLESGGTDVQCVQLCRSGGVAQESAAQPTAPVAQAFASEPMAPAPAQAQTAGGCEVAITPTQTSPAKLRPRWKISRAWAMSAGRARSHPCRSKEGRGISSPMTITAGKPCGCRPANTPNSARHGLSRSARSCASDNSEAADALTIASSLPVSAGAKYV